MHAGPFISRFRIAANVLKPGIYTLGVGAVDSDGNWIWGEDVVALRFAENRGEASAERNRGAVTLPYSAERIQP